MAVSASTSWFHSWSTPNYVNPSEEYFRQNTFDHQPPISRGYSYQRNGPREFRYEDERGGYSRNIKTPSRQPSSTPANFFPYLLQLSMLQPQLQYDDNNNQPYPDNQQPNGQNPNYQPFEISGPFKTWYAWKQVDFEYPSEEDRQRALYMKEFVPENNLPLGMEVFEDRIFVTLPKWKEGVPATLAVLPRQPLEVSPKMVPYPNWDWHTGIGCDGLTSVYRMNVDECGRLWVLDSGQVDVTEKPNQICPPTLFIFDLKTDTLFLRYTIPEEFIKQDSLYSNIKVDVREGECQDAHAYMADVWRFGIVVFSLAKMSSWRVTDHLFYPDPLASAYNVNGLEFEWTDGVFGLALGPFDKNSNDRVLYFHPMSSFREFKVLTSVIRNETNWSDYKNAFQLLGESRGKSGQSSASAVDRNGILFYNQVTRNSVGCWDTRKPYKRKNLGLVVQNNETVIFPNDMKVDLEPRQSVWVVTNRLPTYLYKKLNPDDYNFRIMSAYVDEAVRNTICDPSVRFDFGVDYYNERECY